MRRGEAPARSRTLAATILLLAAALTAGCSGVDMTGGTPLTERQRCEQDRGGGVWVPAAGACSRGGGN